MIRRALSAAAVLAAMALAPAAYATTNKETPGSPCTPGGGQGTGNPCNGNNGNPSPEGNAGETVKYDKKPPLFTVVRGDGRGAVPPDHGRGLRQHVAPLVPLGEAQVEVAVLDPQLADLGLDPNLR